jgi:cysteine synthase B
MLGRVRGYPVTIIAPDNVTQERRELLAFYGASLIETPGARGTKGSIERAGEIAATRPDLCWLNQYANPANPLAHYETTGPELIRQVGHIDVLVAGVGSGGTLMGTGRRLREAFGDVKVVGVEPHPGSKVAGLRNLEEDSFVPPILDLSKLDARLIVSSRDAFRMVHAASRLGLFLGLSAGAVLHGAIRYARRLERGRVCAVLADNGWKYLSIGVCRAEEELGAAVDEVLEVSW